MSKITTLAELRLEKQLMKKQMSDKLIILKQQGVKAPGEIVKLALRGLTPHAAEGKTVYKIVNGISGFLTSSMNKLFNKPKNPDGTEVKDEKPAWFSSAFKAYSLFKKVKKA